MYIRNHWNIGIIIFDWHKLWVFIGDILPSFFYLKAPDFVSRIISFKSIFQ